MANPTRPVHIVIVGAGAIGCFYASRLHYPEHNVYTSLIARSNYSELARSGVRLLTRSFGDYTFVPAAVFPSVAAAAIQPDGKDDAHDNGGVDGKGPRPRQWDFVVVTTKALPDRADDSALIAPLVGPDTCIVLIQNGVGVEDPYRRRFPSTPIVSGVTVVSAEQIQPGVVRQNRWTRLHMGPYTDSASFSASAFPPPLPSSSSAGGAPSLPSPPSSSLSARSREQLTARGTAATEQLASWLSRLGGVRDAEALDETALQTVRWHKLTINAAMNPSSILAGGRGNADMVSSDDGGELGAHLAGVMHEVWEAAPRVLGRPFPPDLAAPDRILRSTARNAGARPSMLLDWEAGRPLEIEVILGNPLRIARAKGVDMPRMQTLYALLRSAQMMRDRAAAEQAREKKREPKL